MTGKPGKIFIRSKSSDERVFWQIYIDREYKPVIDVLKLNRVEVKNIIDAGANIGLTSLVFSEAFPTARIISIEPDDGNFNSLEKNTTRANVSPLKKAIWHSITELQLDRSFRDGEAWSVQVKEPELNNRPASLTPTTTFREIIQNNNWEHIDLLKVDIEGAERFIFDQQYDISFLDKTKCIALEIHDEYGIRNTIHDLLVKKHFFLFEEGELTIGINQSLAVPKL